MTDLRHLTGWRIAGLCTAWLAGMAVQLQEAALLPAAWHQAACLAGLAMCLAGWRWRRVWMAPLLGLAVLGWGTAEWQAASRLAGALDPSLEGVELVVTGVVAGLPQRGPSGVRFRFEVEQAAQGDRPVQLPPTLALGWYAGFHEDAVLTQPQMALGAGQRWRLGVKLKQPHGLVNPHGFDAELQMLSQGIRATGHVRDAVPPRLLGREAAHPVERWRQALRDAIEVTVPDRRAAGVLAALAVGDQSAIEREDWDLFRNAGIAHLVSISGLHITMFAWLAARLIGWAWRRHPHLPLRLPAPLAARWGGLLAAWAYAVFSGWGVPSQRTIWMLALVTLLQSTGRRWPWPLVLLLAAVLVSALEPWALLQAGFWLSFVAVGLLMASGPVTAQSPSPSVGMRRAWDTLRGELRSQVVATVGLTPLTLVFFQQVSIVGFLANLVAIPLVTLVITPLAMLGVIAAPLWLAGAWVVNLLCGWLAAMTAWPAAVWTVPVAPAWAQAAALGGAALLVMPLPWRGRLLAVPMVLPLLMPSVVRPPPGQFELVAADIGQGTAVLVRTQRHLMVFDTGPQYGPGADAGQRVLVPLLHARGERQVDRLMLSHRDADHVGGAASLVTAVAVREMHSSLEDAHPLLALSPPHQRCMAGQSWEWDGVRFEVLHPRAEAYDAQLKSNAMSCVVRVIGLGGSAMLTGDVEREGETWMVGSTSAARLASDVLVVPHHGSKTSSTPAFIDAVHPRFAVFQAGYRNPFGHPAPLVFARYADRHITTISSPSCGAWSWSSLQPGQGVCQRDADARYWHHGSRGVTAQERVEGVCAVWPGFC
ncbi:DNA internalization-related competence protein ComEC/Rec2 [Piscinibacter terrae]|uniref:DNA internalization-related competence protein ComEC/Rec2 n=1 Tax=Piscinibacter terrae TaxID=2496871 RepID=A0A3N7HNV2_9BURK|nr:DNA internalization-related competence protein ComEC/Rec2 [Albitalea terrae]RQP23878.1 DNA internalization-related competence protein ComEC/Rec2 [Albitalea terrae]